MFNKKIRHYILFFFIEHIIFVYVSGKSIDSANKRTFDKSWENLAKSVCSILEDIESVDPNNCETVFKKSQLPSVTKQPAPVKIRCLTEINIVFQIKPSQYLQLVVFKPELPQDEIYYSLIEPMQEYADVDVYLGSNFTLWSTELVEGTPVEWQGGHQVPQYKDISQSEHKTYDVKIQYSLNANNAMLLDGLFTWNVTGDTDVCFIIVNTCDKTMNMLPIRIWPYNKPETILTDMSMEDDCNITVKGVHGDTSFPYRTPSCYDYLDCVAAGGITPEYAKNVSIDVIEDTSDTWEVRVRWLPPVHAVEQYNITLNTNPVHTLVVDGDATEVVFKGVTGEGFFFASVYTRLGRWTAHTSRQFQLSAQGGARAGGQHAARGALLGAAACAAAALALACLWRRRGRGHDLPHYTTEVKPSKENDIEAVILPLEAEDSWEIRSDKLLLHEVIGEGAFGVVRRATLAPNGTNVAVKMLKDFPSLEEIRSFRSEMELMKSVGVHPHLVSLVGCCSGRRPLIIAEYCSRGDLLTYLRCTWDVMVSKRNAKYYNNNIDTSDYRNDLFKCKTQMENSKLVVNKLYELQEICDKELTTLDLLSFCRQIAMGMEFLAANRVVHRDLAARNILVTADRTLKIADFGLSRDVYEENQYKQKGNGKMPVKWMALESLTRRIYTTQSDVWSFGVVVWEVATVGAAPYASVPAARLPRLLRAGYRMPRPANCSPQLYDIMLSCWRSQPRARPTFGALHARLDELLNSASSASAHHYLSLEIEPLDAPRHHRYIKMFMRGKRNYCSRGENYERPLKPSQSNHYTSPPIVLTKSPPV